MQACLWEFKSQFLLKSFFFRFIFYFILLACISVYQKHALFLWRWEEVVRSLETEVIEVCEPLCEWWNGTWSLREQQVLLTSEPPPRSLLYSTPTLFLCLNLGRAQFLLMTASSNEHRWLLINFSWPRIEWVRTIIQVKWILNGQLLE